MFLADRKPFDLDAYFEVEIAYTEYNALRALRADSPALEVRRDGAVVGVRDPNRADGYYNRVFGPIQVNSPGVEEMLRWVEEAGGNSVVEALVKTDSTDVPDGWRLAREKVVLELPANAQLPRRAPPGGIVRRAARSDLDRVFELWEDVAQVPLGGDTLESKKAAQMDPRFPIFVLELDGDTIAMATSFVSHGQAWLGNATTEAKYRRRGAHSTLVAHRVEHARRAGATSVLVDLESGGASHASVLRLGFEPRLGLRVYTRGAARSAV